MLVASTHAAEGDSRITADVRALRSAIHNAQRAFTRVRDSKGSDTREFDVAIMRLRLGINALNASLKSEKQVSGATSRGGRRQSRSIECLLQVAGKGACTVGLARGRARSGTGCSAGGLDQSGKAEPWYGEGKVQIIVLGEYPKNPGEIGGPFLGDIAEPFWEMEGTRQFSKDIQNMVRRKIT